MSKFAVATAIGFLCSAALLATPKVALATPEVHFLIGGLWPNKTAPVQAGLQAMTQQMLAIDPDFKLVRTHNTQWKKVCHDIGISKPTGPLVLIGHSLGGQAVMDISRCLGESYHRKVDLVISLDPMQKFFHPAVGRVPENVVRNANFYQTQDFWWRGHRDEHRDDGSHNGITNTKITIPEGMGSYHQALVNVLGQDGTLAKLIQEVGNSTYPQSLYAR